MEATAQIYFDPKKSATYQKFLGCDYTYSDYRHVKQLMNPLNTKKRGNFDFNDISRLHEFCFAVVDCFKLTNPYPVTEPLLTAIVSLDFIHFYNLSMLLSSHRYRLRNDIIPCKDIEIKREVIGKHDSGFAICGTIKEIEKGRIKVENKFGNHSNFTVDEIYDIPDQMKPTYKWNF